VVAFETYFTVEISIYLCQSLVVYHFREFGLYLFFIFIFKVSGVDIETGGNRPQPAKTYRSQALVIE